MSEEIQQADPEPTQGNEGLVETVKETHIADDGAQVVVQGERVEIRQGGAQTVEGEHVELHQGGAQYIRGETVTMDKSGAMTLQAEQVTMSMSGAGIISAEQVTLQEDSSAGVIAARRVDGSQINTRLLLAGEVYGNVETAVDTRGALLIGLGMGIGLGLLLSLKSLFSGKE